MNWDFWGKTICPDYLGLDWALYVWGFFVCFFLGGGGGVKIKFHSRKQGWQSANFCRKSVN